MNLNLQVLVEIIVVLVIAYVFTLILAWVAVGIGLPTFIVQIVNILIWLFAGIHILRLLGFLSSPPTRI